MDDFYVEIPNIISQNLYIYNRAKINNLELNRIHNLFSNKYHQYGSVFTEDSLQITFGSSPNRTSLYKINIIKHEDEWFYLWFEPSRIWIEKPEKYFKCDQIDGLLKCIDDILKYLPERK